MQQTVVWTALPDGVRSGRLALSVLISPRLRADGAATLGDFDDWADWPSQQIDWIVELGTGEQLPAVRVRDVRRSDVWQALLPSSLPVRSWQQPRFTDRVVHSFPVGHVLDHLADAYASAALDPEPPTVDELLADGGAFAALPSYRNERDRPEQEALDEIERRMRSRRPDGTPARAVPPGPPEPALDFAQASRFHAPLRTRPDHLEPVTRPEWDLHRVLAALGPHAPLLRALGLLVDLETAEPVLRRPGETTVRVRPRWTPQTQPTADARPATRCWAGPERFEALPTSGDSETGGGLLRIGPDARRYRVEQVDPDGAALKARDFATNLAQTVRFRSADTPFRAALPALRSAGLQLVRTGRATAFVDRLDKAAAANSTDGDDDAMALDAAVLSAEDLLRGFRLDVGIDGRWFSLHRRRATYALPDVPAVSEADVEGAVSTVPSARPDEPDAFYLHESVAQWTGWSLSAPRPADSLRSDGTVLPDGEVAVDPMLPLRMELEAVEGSLPPLRFGRRYRLRARAVDLAGNSLPPDLDDAVTGPSLLPVGNGRASTAAPGEVLTEEVPYLRWEPIASPALLLQRPRTEGESVDRIVLRSDFNQAPGEASPDLGAAFTYDADAQRHIAAPRVAELLAEEHGMLDAGGRVDADVYGMLVERANGDLEQVPGAQADPGSYQRVYYPGPSAGQPDLPVPYLPDPLARAAAFRGLPGREEPLLVPLQEREAWPVTHPIRLVLTEGAAGTDDPVGGDDPAAERVLTVRLAKAGRATVQLSSAPGRAGLNVLGQWWSMLERHPGSDTPERTTGAATGGSWILTPARTVELIHAVRRPLLPVELDDLGVTRAAGATFATLRGTLPFHRESTGRVDLHATWEERVDPGLGEGHAAGTPWFTRSGSQELQVPIRGRATALDLDLGQEFGDTRARRVTYTSTATSAFTEYFTTRRVVTLPATLDERGVVPGSETVRDVPGPDGEAERHRVGVDYTLDPATGRLEPKPGSALAEGDVVEVAYLVPPVSRSSSASVTRLVPASARPPAPKVLYAVPTFGWRRSASGDSVTSERRGNGLRIWMDRPWYVSGDEERLAVLLDATQGAPSPELAPYTTSWGYDPGTTGRPTRRRPRAEDFKAIDFAASSLPLAEDPDRTVTAAVHQVGFDDARSLWWCDVEIDAGRAYFPFVRLALARYQRDALEGLELSPVVLADYAQLAPNRVATVTRDGGTVRIAVVGIGYEDVTGAVGRFAPARIVAELQRQDPAAGEDDAFGWTAVGGPRSRVALSPARGEAGEVRWTGQLRLPVQRTGGPALRLVLDESEVRQTGRGDQVGERVVYSDVIPL